MPKIFISYRRADTRKDAGRIYDRLIQAFGKAQIFKDVDDIPAGRDFRGVLAEAVAQCDVLLAFIGKQWLNIVDEEGHRRLDNPGDFVRIEVQTALQRDRCLVVPILLDGAGMPRADDLPIELRELAFRNAIIVRDDPDFHRDVGRLISDLQKQFLEETSKVTTPTSEVDVYQIIGDYYAARKDKDWERARELLLQIRGSNVAEGIFDVDAQDKALWKAIEQEEAEKKYNVIRIMAQNDTAQRVWQALQGFWQDYPNFDPDGLQDHFQPVQVTESTSSHSLDILEPPFEWIRIRAGKVELLNDWDNDEKVYLKKGQSRKFDVAAFEIAKYPITNAQYAAFVEANGYGKQNYWTQAGWQEKEEQNWTEPRHWQDTKWNGSGQPIVGVSWYEAYAFTQWLSEATGERISLPTEQQWQRAAQGDDGRTYPWGNEWDCLRCNNSVKPCESNGTTTVTQYQGKGDSPFDVVDMAGNVWEWCLTNYATGSDKPEGTDTRVLRGGSWSYDVTDFFRVADRLRNDPHGRNYYTGFRISRSYT